MWEPLFHKVAGLQADNLVKKEIPTQTFSWEFCEMFKNTYFVDHL